MLILNVKIHITPRNQILKDAKSNILKAYNTVNPRKRPALEYDPNSNETRSKLKKQQAKIPKL